jgi:hypothetical protein
MIKPYSLSQLTAEVDLVPQALIAGSLTDLARQHGWTLDEGCDDLDSFVGTAFQLDLPLHPDFKPFTPFALMRYRGHPPATATIYLPFQMQDLKMIDKALGRILKELKLSQRLLWQRRHDGRTPAA